jgi:hypothetical protein
VQLQLEKSVHWRKALLNVDPCIQQSSNTDARKIVDVNTLQCNFVSFITHLERLEEEKLAAEQSVCWNEDC